ncbi:protein-glutamate O-methyltransferase CheR [Bermanella marisrubri]|uniref:protein-glutamate O-methyltransferase n=1 Tax=Bermanella marisrubri TaxID=207949 RepID=Q1N2W4_9GAMM|nr:protein-glutamate O-methyltransferase CheR [Bermanella marisrubri]EAT12555.1 Methylase of chemotaxis methyl-accepting protein [Oceanobacter sp. RED65] [Bermanella marisrubri]QIZ84888.1 protein-glutamate O-methyltransferase CheR [Bermanella marisrubri]
MTEQDFSRLSRIAFDVSGIVLSDAKKELVYSRIARRVRALGLSRFSEYCEYLDREKEKELNEFINSITTNLTSFFRESHHFEFLAKEIITQWRKNPKEPIRIWSSACSTGPEPYSIAITLRKNIKVDNLDIRILATDLDSDVLKKAKSGEYPLKEIELLPRDYHNCFYKNEDGAKARIKDEYKGLIQFNRLNLLGPWPMKKKFDVIFCRNVVIYFNKDTQVELFNRLHDALKPNGYLMIGHSENLYGANHLFKPLGRTIYQKK